jgi:small-conductance mechanosensitive channel
MDATALTGMFFSAIIAIAMAIAGYFASILAVRIVRPIAERFLEPGLSSFVISLARASVLLLTLKLIIDQTGAAGVLVIIVTAITGAFALGSERIASDVVAGINLFMLRYYRVGDLVTIGKHHGRIVYISLTHTSLSNRDRDKIIIPNSEVLNQVIVNHTGIPGARLKADIPIEGDHDRDEVMGFLYESARSYEPQLRGSGDEPSIVLKDVISNQGNRTSIYQIYVIVPEANYGEDHRLFLHLRRAVEARLARIAAEKAAAEAAEKAAAEAAATGNHAVVTAP